MTKYILYVQETYIDEEPSEDGTKVLGMKFLARSNSYDELIAQAQYLAAIACQKIYSRVWNHVKTVTTNEVTKVHYVDPDGRKYEYTVVNITRLPFPEGKDGLVSPSALQYDPGSHIRTRPEITFDPEGDEQWPNGRWECGIKSEDTCFGLSPDEALMAWEKNNYANPTAKYDKGTFYPPKES
jgi:hypothetical protein